MERFKNLLVQCPYHGLKQWLLYQIMYNGFEQQTRTRLASMSHGEFWSKNPTTAENFLEDLVKKKNH